MPKEINEEKQTREKFEIKWSGNNTKEDGKNGRRGGGGVKKSNRTHHIQTF